MSIEPDILLTPKVDTHLLDSARVNQIRRFFRVFFKVSARLAVRRSGRPWAKLPLNEKMAAIESEILICEQMGVTMIPRRLQTLEFFCEWLSQRTRPERYLTAQPAG